MNANSLWNDALENASADDLARFAQLVPKTLANASAPEQEGNSRGKGLLLTKNRSLTCANTKPPPWHFPSPWRM